MGCVQEKSKSQVVNYENWMGEQLSKRTGKDIENTQVIVMGITQDNSERAFAFDVLTQKFKALTLPQGMTVWNYSSLVHISNKEIFITGGLSASASEISNQAYIYDSISGVAVKLPNMACPRYTHISIFFKGKLYAIGGRDYGDDDDSAIRPQCERFNFFMHRWEKITKLNVPRCTGFSFIYKDSIYVCGGLTGKMHRSRAIERYDESNDRWILLDFKLSRGMECGTILSASHFLSPQQAKDKFIIVGGNTEEGSQDTMYTYSMADQTVISGPSLNQRRVLQKTIAYNHKVYVFGGSETDGVETYDSQSNSWKEDKNQSFSVFVSPQDIDLFSYSQPPVTIPDEVPILPKPNSNFQVGAGKSQNDSYNKQGIEVIQYNLNVSHNNSETQGGDNEQQNKEYAVNDNSQQNIVISSNNLQLKLNAFNQEIQQKAGSVEQELSSITTSLIKEDLLLEKSYLFGTDVDPIIMEIDYENVKVERKSVPLSIRLFQYQGIASIQEDKTIILMGGVHDGMNKTVNYTYVFDTKKWTGKRVQNMIVPSFAFPTLTLSPYVYAIGGKSTNTQNNSNNNDNDNNIDDNNSSSATILAACQRYNIITQKWESLPNLNVKRVSAMVTNFYGKIYVFGGFKGDLEQVRPNEIEVYNPESPFKDFKNQPAWEVMSVKFPIGLEGAPLLSVINQNQQPDILIFGGRTSSGEIRYISKLSLHIEQPEVKQDKENEEEEEDEEQYEPSITIKLDKVSQMLQSRCLHKVVQPYKQFALILGGQLEPYIECVNLAKNYSTSTLSNIPHIDPIVQKLNSQFKKIKDHSIKQYSFTSL